MDNNNFKRRKNNDRYSKNEDKIVSVRSSKLAKLLFVINLIAVAGLIFFINWKNILPFLERIIVTIIILIIEVIVYMLIRDKRKLGLNIFAFIIMIALTGASVMAINIATKVDRTINKLNKDNVVVEEEAVKYQEPFNIYISGIDTYGDVNTVSRSDVNIIATFNPKTGKVLLTSVPRDSYLKISGKGKNQYDKLTHAGIYGVQTSVKTLENALDIKIPYYARINFDSLIKMIDVLGGVEVDNPVAFKSRVSDNYYEKGKIHLDGQRALFFVRERYNLPNGDHDRGRNQERVIAAMIKKVATPGSLLKMDEILKVVESSVNTNLSSNKAIELLNSVISNGGNLNISSQDITGKGAKKPSYAMGNQKLYVLIINEESLRENRNNILKILDTSNNIEGN